jgi:murein DD-endopeptidase MepM/ murein hydrolase activator NlpD
MAAILVAALSLIIGAASAAAQDVAIPSPPATTPAPGAAPAPTAAAPDPAAPAPSADAGAPAPAATPAEVTLRIGSAGPLVKDLQSELRRRGLRVAVDGAFGPATKKAVKKLQKRLKLRPTGVASPSFLTRIGVSTRLAAAATTPVAPKIAPGASPYLSVFPVAGTYTYTDDFGQPRHQGRHEGNDIMADRGTPLLAVDDASVVRLSRTETGLGGISIWLERAGDGTQYYYAHMTTIAAGLDVGSKVGVGQVIGSVGNTGDARYGAPHLHFELHPGGGDAVDPYPHLVAVDPTARTQARTAR